MPKAKTDQKTLLAAAVAVPLIIIFTSQLLDMSLGMALILLSLFALASGLGALRDRVPALSGVPFLSKIPAPRVPFLNRRR